jgi:hypothetical protein
LPQIPTMKTMTNPLPTIFTSPESATEQSECALMQEHERCPRFKSWIGRRTPALMYKRSCRPPASPRWSTQQQSQNSCIPFGWSGEKSQSSCILRRWSRDGWVIDGGWRRPGSPVEDESKEEEEHESEEDKLLAGPTESVLVAFDLLGRRPTQSDLDME